MDASTKLGVGALIAAGGYVARLVVHEWMDWRRKRQFRRARLLRLSSLLSATHYAFAIQAKHRDRLAALLSASHPNEARLLERGYEELFSILFKTLSPGSEEFELHTLIRGLTIYALKPSNRAISKWLADDIDFRTREHGKGYRGDLAAKLNLLASHLLSWHAEYEIWIPNHPEHALVYLEDERNHGVGFPKGIEDLVQKALAEF
jgi:hypothetical protein